MFRKLFLTFCVSVLHAAPIGNPATPGLLIKGFYFPCNSAMSLRGGYEGDFVTDARMEQKGSERVDNYKQDTNSGTLTFNFVNRLDVTAIFGASKTFADWRFIDSTDVVHWIKLKTHHNFLWAFAGNAILFEWGRACLGAGGRYSSSRYKPEWIHSNGTGLPEMGTRLKWKEWQANLGLSYRIDLFTPYVGVKYSKAETEFSHFSIGNGEFTNKDNVGLYLGCSLTTGAYFYLNLEARLFDEEAFTVVGDFRF